MHLYENFQSERVFAERDSTYLSNTPSTYKDKQQTRLFVNYVPQINDKDILVYSVYTVHMSFSPRVINYGRKKGNNV